MRVLFHDDDGTGRTYRIIRSIQVVNMRIGFNNFIFNKNHHNDPYFLRFWNCGSYTAKRDVNACKYCHVKSLRIQSAILILWSINEYFIIDFTCCAAVFFFSFFRNKNLFCFLCTLLVKISLFFSFWFFFIRQTKYMINNNKRWTYVK